VVDALSNSNPETGFGPCPAWCPVLSPPKQGTVPDQRPADDGSNALASRPMAAVTSQMKKRPNPAHDGRACLVEGKRNK
jgi:hypothetical protein